MGAERGEPAAAPLGNGRVLVAGGYGGGSDLTSAEVFEPLVNSFLAGIGSATRPREFAAAAPLSDGRALVAGGFNLGGYQSSAEVFDPATNTFSSAGIGEMGTARQGDAAAPLPDGRVLVAGGYDGSSFLSSAEIFSLANPSTAISPTVKRQRLFATVAVAGTVQIADAAIGNLKRKLKPVRVSGGPGQISVRLRLTRLAGRRLRKKGKVKVWARISFTPTRHVGECVSAFAQCYSSRFADTETMRLTLTGRRHKRTRRG